MHRNGSQDLRFCNYTIPQRGEIGDGWYNLSQPHGIGRGRIIALPPLTSGIADTMTRAIWFLIGFILLAGFLLVWQASRGASVLVEWETASELDTVGFNLYRAGSPEGPFVQVNSELIPASSEPLTGAAYNYSDNNVQPGNTYYYELEEVEFNGGRSRFGPIVVQAKSRLSTAWYLLLGVLLVLLLGGGVLYTRRSAVERRERADSPLGEGG